MSATVHTTSGLGSVTVLPDGTARIVRALPGFGMFLTLELTADEVAIIRKAGA